MKIPANIGRANEGNEFHRLPIKFSKRGAYKVSRKLGKI